MSTDDPLEQFFARERAAIEPHSTSEDHWASIVRERRRAGGPPAWRWVLGAAAAVAVVGAIGLSMRPGDRDDALPATTSTGPTTSETMTGPSVVTVTTTVAGTPTTVAGTPTTVTIPPTSGATGGPVLKAFDVVSVTNSGNGHRAALGTTSCSGSRCAAVITSADDGAHWSVASSFRGEVPGPEGPRILRFADDKVGWLVGDTVRRTTDGGRTWDEFAHPGKHVFGLETDGRDVVIVAGDSPTADGTTELVVSRAEVGATSALAVGRPMTATAFTGADVVWGSHTAYVMPHSEAGDLGPQRVDEAALTRLPSPGGRTPVAFAASAGDQTLFSLVARGGAAGSAAYGLRASTDGGATWTDRTTGDVPLLLANAGRVAFAATDGSHLVAVSGGTPDLHGSMKVTSDGGRTWHEPAKAPPLPDRGWAWVGSPGDKVVYAVPVDPSGAHWWSGDHGEHWEQAVLGS